VCVLAADQLSKRAIEHSVVAGEVHKVLPVCEVINTRQDLVHFARYHRMFDRALLSWSAASTHTHVSATSRSRASCSAPCAAARLTPCTPSSAVDEALNHDAVEQLQ